MEQEQNRGQDQEAVTQNEEVQITPTGNDFRADKTEPPKADLSEHKSRKWLIILIVVLLLAVAVGLVYSFVINKDSDKQNSSDDTSEVSEAEQERADPNTIKMLATGDWIAHDSVNDQAKTTDGYDYLKFMTAWQPLMGKSDLNFCNLATPAGGEQYGISGYPIFNAPFDWIHDMKSLGCNVVNTGTNHTNDKGQRVITSELGEIDKQEFLAAAGANRSIEEQQAVRYFDIKGVKFAFLSYSTYTNISNPNAYSLNMFNPSLYEPQMQEANEKADIVIVSMRWGTEYSEEVNGRQVSDAQTLSNLGADIVLGHGPHVLQPVQEFTGTNGNKTIVWHSLGNFINTQLEVEALTGCVASLEIDVPSKSVRSNACLPYYMHYEWTAEQAAAEDLLKRTNLQIVPLDTATELIAKSQLGTTVEEQTTRISGIINTNLETPILKSSDY